MRTIISRVMTTSSMMIGRTVFTTSILMTSMLCQLAAVTFLQDPIHKLPGPTSTSGWLNVKLAAADDWVTHGGDHNNWRFSRAESNISINTAASFGVKWSFTTQGDVSATPAIYKGVIYCPDWGGMLNAIDQKTGRLIWRKNLTSDYGIQKNVYGRLAFSRTTPAIAPHAKLATRDTLVIGVYNPAVIIAVRRSTGQMLWKKTVDFHRAAQITGGGTAYSGHFYVGVSSNEEALAIGDYDCCTFRGSLVKLDLTTGKTLWQRYTVQPNNNRPGGFSGGAIWAATPAIDPIRRLVYVGVGNFYEMPTTVQSCLDAGRPERECIPAGNYYDAVLAVHMDTGAVVWSKILNPIDAWNGACLTPVPGPNCPAEAGPDADFGMSPMLLTIRPNPLTSATRDVAIIGQKSGIVWALDRRTGATVWSRAAGPGGILGGASWGMATDGRRIYVGIMNDYGRNFTLVPSTRVVTSGGWVALNANTGVPLWSQGNPAGVVSAFGVIPTVANGVLMVGSPDPTGKVYALNAANGQFLWEYTTGASVYGGFAVDSGCAYVGKGYISLHSLLATTGGGKQSIIAFCVDPKKKIPPPRPPPPRPPPYVHIPKVINVGGHNGWLLNVFRTWTQPTVYVCDQPYFAWSEALNEEHDVWVLTGEEAFNTCNFTGGYELGHNHVLDAAFSVPGTYYFACKEEDHCLLNQKVAINVLPVPGAIQNLAVPYAPKIIDVGGMNGWVRNIFNTWNDVPPIHVGDRIVFSWPQGEVHNVARFGGPGRFERCEFGTATILSTSNNFLYGPFTAPGIFFFSSSVAGDCINQLKFIIRVVAAPQYASDVCSRRPQLSPPPPMPPPPLVYTPQVVDVGGYGGWLLNVNKTWTPPSLHVCDQLYFAWDEALNEEHDVWVLTGEEAFNTCNFTGGFELGHNHILDAQFSAPGTYYYAFKEDDHCALQQKVAVTVLPDPYAATSALPYVARTVDVGGPNGWVRNLTDNWPLASFHVGDSIRFSWPNGTQHDVSRFRGHGGYETCNFTRATVLSNTSNFVFGPFAKEGVYFFSSSIAGDCRNNLKLLVRVVPAPAFGTGECLRSQRTFPSPLPPAFPPPPLVPAPPARSPQTITIGGRKNGWDLGVKTPTTSGWPVPPIYAGDSLFFEWINAHDVWLMKDKNSYDRCIFNTADGGSIILSPNAVVGAYTYGPIDASKRGTTLYFGCSIAGHCAAGMMVAIPVY